MTYALIVYALGVPVVAWLVAKTKFGPFDNLEFNSFVIGFLAICWPILAIGRLGRACARKR